MMNKQKIRLAIIGCGAVSEIFHIPAARKSAKVELKCIFDANIQKAQELAEKNMIPIWGSKFMQFLPEFDAAIVAAPNFLHHTITMQLLNAGKHVMVEKPMAINSEHCVEMCVAAKRNERILTIGQIRRHYPKNLLIKEIIEKKVFGEFLGASIREGYIFNWPMASDAFLKKEKTGGGVLYDIGVHVIDILTWWFGKLSVRDYADDSRGGIESDCKIALETKDQKTITVELSRQRNIANEIALLFEKALIKTDHELQTEIILNLDPQNNTLPNIIGSLNKDENIGYIEVFSKQIDEFANSIEYPDNLLVIPEDGVNSISVIENCLSIKKEIEYEWEKI